MHIQLAEKKDLLQVIKIFKERVKWFKKKKIKQWDSLYYLVYYNILYLFKIIKQDKLYVVKNNNMVIGIFLIKKEDTEYWDDDKKAYYIRHFSTKLGNKGLGEVMFKFIEDLAKENNIRYLRLDCVRDSFISEYWQNHGFKKMGTLDKPYPCYLYEKEIIK